MISRFCVFVFLSHEPAESRNIQSGRRHYAESQVRGGKSRNDKLKKRYTYSFSRVSRCVPSSHPSRSLLVALAAVAAADAFMLTPGCHRAAARLPLGAKTRLVNHGVSRVVCVQGTGGGGGKKGSPGAEEGGKMTRWQRFVAGVADKGPKYVMGDISREKLQKVRA